MHDPVYRLNAALEGRYRIERELGEGGMATVYLANDLRHERKIALKVLKPELAAAIGADRFLAEIKTTANLQHPHILPLFDSGEAESFLYYVMPYVEGESLKERLERERQLPVDEAVRIAVDVAEALFAAHEQGVIHRDIKPANVLLSAGQVFVADFGVALAVGKEGASRLTQTGMSVGTPQYMSPEQATGEQALGASSDIYSLACVLYEMLAGDPPFIGSNLRAVLAKIVTEKPVKLTTIRDTVPLHVEATVDKALAKVPVDRFASAQAFSEALCASIPEAVSVEGEAGAGSSWRRRLWLAVPAGVAAVAVASALLTNGGDSADGDSVGSAIRPLTSLVGWEVGPSWSPDGSMIAYGHIVGGDADVATLSIAGGDPHILTEASPADDLDPRWSPDGSKIAFKSDRGAGTDIYWIPPTGGAEHKVAETHIPFLERLGAWAGALGANPWSPDGQELLFSRLGQTGQVALWKVSMLSGEETQLTFPPQGTEDLSGSWSFDGERIAFTRDDRGRRSLWMLAEGEASLLLGGEGNHFQSAWFPDGRRLAFVSTRGGGRNLWEIEIDTRELRQLTVGAVGNDGGPVIATNGMIAYANWSHDIDVHWIQLGADGEEHARLTSSTGDNFGARVSPDGRSVAYYSNRSGDHDLWIFDRATGRHRQVTDDPASDRLLDWSPQGDEIVFMSDRGGPVRLWVVRTETGVVRPLTDHELPWSSHTAEGQGGPRWSPDGHVIAYVAPEEGNAIWLVAPDGSDRRASAVRGVLSFDWFRDSERVIYTRRSPDGSGLIELRAAHLRTGEDVMLRAGAVAEVGAAPDGSALTFLDAVSHFAMELYLLPLTATTQPDQLPGVAGEPQRLTFGNGVWHAHSGGWAPDSKNVVYSRDRDFGDIYVIEPRR
jgi:serine/threonine-protein kinase